MKRVFILGFIITLILTQFGLADIPQTISYQGLLTDDDGKPVHDGNYSIVFRIYDSSLGGVALWTETHSSVAVVNGIFNVILGGAALPSPLNLPFDKPYWLGITVNGSVLNPLIQLTASPYSLNSRSVADGAVTSAKIPSGQVVKSINTLKDNVTLAAGTNVTITPSGNTLTISSASNDAWKLLGNAGTTPGTHFVGTTDNKALELRVNGSRTLRLEPNATSPNLLGGYSGNSITSGVYAATIGGGGQSANINRVTDNYGTVSGGVNNQAGDNAGTADDAYYPTVSGGRSNEASGQYTSIGGGYSNKSQDSYATVGGGYSNDASANSATISGGYSNGASANYATIGGGFNNNASSDNTTISGGLNNIASGSFSSICGGYSNNVSSYSATISGGYDNTASGNYVTVGGGYSNNASSDSATIGGGYNSSASASYATVGGGSNNTTSGSYATIGGGRSNQAIADYATIGGGGRSDPNSSSTGNRVKDSYGTIGGGGNNQAGDDETAYNNASYATVGGGKSNKAIDEYTTVGGGVSNIASGAYSVIAGGVSNDATGNYSFIGGGDNNQATKIDTTIGGGFENEATGGYTTISGGWINEASGEYATIPGGAYNVAQGDYSFAAGRRAKANGNGCFVWGDSTAADITASGANQFKARASGGVWFYSTSDLTKGVKLEAGATGWVGFNTSDKALKYNIRSVDEKDILYRLSQIPISRWTYQSEEPKIEHLGPMAQDFYAAFGAGEDGSHISTVDADGVALAAIQGLYQIVKEKDAEISELKSRIETLEKLVLSGVKDE